ncbi:MAG: hypothetical protein V4660_20640 [Pseudomonadota bacterium]
MNILEKLKSKDVTQILSACSEVAKCRDLDELKMLSPHVNEIKKATKSISLGGALCPNSYHLDFAIKKLEHVKKDLGCLCALYPENMFYNPVTEQQMALIAIDEVVKIDNKWIDYYLCRCAACNSEFKVEERDGHYTWWSWKRI